MINTNFLDKIAHQLLVNYSSELSNIVVVLPNKRAKVFLLEAIRKQLDSIQFAPEIVSIEDFIQDMSGVRSADAIELLFEFYDLYLSITKKESIQPFETFANWATTLLQDFSEIDRYLLNPTHVLTYLKDIDDIKKWGISAEDKTPLLEKYIDFWKLLPSYYESLYTHLLNKGVGYQGMIYREAISNLDHFSNTIANKKFVFAGFNALTVAEEKIIQHLISLDIATVYWDIDQVFMKDENHEAGLFLRKFKENWKYYKSNPFEWIFDDFSSSKKIRIIGTPKAVGQAKIIGSIIDDVMNSNPSSSLNNMAVVLGDENLLLPILYSLPASVENLNITMGYSSKNNPTQILVSKLFKMHTNALSRETSKNVFYYKDILDVITHPLIEPYANAKELVRNINQNNYTFISYKKLMSIHKNPNALFFLLFEPWAEDPCKVLEKISDLLLVIKSNLSNDVDDEKIAKAFVYSIYRVINRLINYYSKQQYTTSIQTLYAIYKQVIDLAEVSFEGEPLNGLQIMGVLESRALDFETVIISSLNEGNLPLGKSQNSFIPYDLKMELGLPTFKEKDAIYTYHFYHLLQRAKNIYLIYNTESEGIDAGEKSRFITQLEIEKQEEHELTHDLYSAEIPEFSHQMTIIPKSYQVLLRLEEIAKKGFSPSALTSYIRNPIDFYFQKILHIREVEEVEETVALNTLGTIIHETLRALYEPFVGIFLSEKSLENCLKLVDAEVLNQFQVIYKEGEIKKGRNLLAFEVAKRNVSNFIKMEIDSLKAGDLIKIIALEKTFERVLEHPSLPYPVLIKGNVDRIEERSFKGEATVIRIIDYKTGKVEKGSVTLSYWKDLTKEIKNDKIIQILSYAYMYEKEANKRPIQAGIISFKNLKSGFLPFNFKEENESKDVIDECTLADFTEQLVLLLNEILDPLISFTEKEL